MRKIRLDEINLHPDFQRRLVWDKTRQSRLIESILISIPLPARLVFDDYVFRKIYEVGGQRYPINKALFEMWSVALLKYDLDCLGERKDDIVRAFVRVMNEDEAFNRAISHSTGSVKNVHKRFSTIENLLAEVMS